MTPLIEYSTPVFYMGTLYSNIISKNNQKGYFKERKETIEKLSVEYRNKLKDIANSVNYGKLLEYSMKTNFRDIEINLRYLTKYINHRVQIRILPIIDKSKNDNDTPHSKIWVSVSSEDDNLNSDEVKEALARFDLMARDLNRISRYIYLETLMPDDNKKQYTIKADLVGISEKYQLEVEKLFSKKSHEQKEIMGSEILNKIDHDLFYNRLILNQPRNSDLLITHRNEEKATRALISFIDTQTNSFMVIKGLANVDKAEDIQELFKRQIIILDNV